MEISSTNVHTLLSENSPWVIGCHVGGSAGNEDRGQIHTKKGEKSLSDLLISYLKLTFVRNSLFFPNSHHLSISPFKLSCLGPTEIDLGASDSKSCSCKAGALRKVSCETVVKRQAGTTCRVWVWSPRIQRTLPFVRNILIFLIDSSCI